MPNTEAIKKKMRDIGMSQAQLAEILGLAVPTVSQKINGVRMFTLTEAKVVQKTLDIPDAEFCTYFFAQ